MPDYYIYLISSLPMLSFSAGMPFSSSAFFAKCSGLIPQKEISLLRSVCGEDGYALGQQGQPTLARWREFDIALRNELARARAGRKKIDPEKFLRLPDNPQAHISHIAMSAYRNTSILEAERLLDKERWNFLEELTLGHYFDLDLLIIYALKLAILERWDKIESADKEQLLQETLS